MVKSTAGAATLLNTTITGNRVLTSANGGAGLRSDFPALVQNTIIAGNFRGAAPSTTPDDINGTVNASSAFNLIGIGGSGGLTNGVNNNQVGVSNPGLGPLANNGGPTLTVALLPGSPAIDQGSNTYVIAGETDQRGFNRIYNGTVDIGAFEVQPTSAAVVAPSSLVSAAGPSSTSLPEEPSTVAMEKRLAKIAWHWRSILARSRAKPGAPRGGATSYFSGTLGR